MEGVGEEKLYMYFPVLKSVKADLDSLIFSYKYNTVHD